MIAHRGTGDLVEKVREGYAFAGPALDVGALVVDGLAVRDVPVRVPLSMLNRHGLVAGATGTGKTKTTLQLIAEQHLTSDEGEAELRAFGGMSAATGGTCSPSSATAFSMRCACSRRRTSRR